MCYVDECIFLSHIPLVICFVIPDILLGVSFCYWWFGSLWIYLNMRIVFIGLRQ